MNMGSLGTLPAGSCLLEAAACFAAKGGVSLSLQLKCILGGGFSMCMRMCMLYVRMRMWTDTWDGHVSAIFRSSNCLIGSPRNGWNLHLHFPPKSQGRARSSEPQENVPRQAHGHDNRNQRKQGQ